MSIFDDFPLMNAYSVNLDWIIKKMHEIEDFVKDYAAVNKVAYAGVWDITKQYPQWALVTDGDTSWLSNKPVPVGIPLENAEYWQKLADLDPRIAGIIVELAEISKKIVKLSEIQWHFLNVKHYGAVGDGVTDDYKAFKDAYDAAASGQGIYIPSGTYKLSDNPDNGLKAIKWVADIGVRITGDGLGHPESGKGGFMCTTISNPWLVVSGDNLRYNLNNIPCPSGGAVLGDAKELMNMDSGTDRRWYSLEYRGGETGTKDSNVRNVELLNQVLNITGFAGIAQEIDVNIYAKPKRWSSGLLITGRGTGGGDISAIDITRDRGEQKWSTAISVRRANTGIFIDNKEIDTGIQIGENPRKATPAIAFQQKKNGADGLVIRRFTDTDPTGNLIVAWDASESNELFALGCNGDARLGGLPLGMVDSRSHANGQFERYKFRKNVCLILLKRGDRASLIAVDYWTEGYSLIMGSVDGLTIQKSANSKIVDIANDTGLALGVVAIG